MLKWLNYDIYWINFFILVTVDGKKKTKTKAVPLSPPPEEVSQEEEDETEAEEDEEYQQDQDGSETDSSGSSAEENISEDESDAESTPARALKAQKGKTQVKKEGNNKRKKTTSDKHQRKKAKAEVVPAAEMVVKEKQHPDSENAEKGSKKPTKKELARFVDSNCDFDLFNASPNNVVQRKIKVASNLIVTCRMIDQNEGKGLTYDYAALTFQRKTNQEKMFEFIVPLGLVPRLIEAMKIIVNENPKFFSANNKEVV